MKRNRRRLIAAKAKSLKEEAEEKIISFSDSKKTNGTENLPLGGGWKVQVVKKQTVSVISDENEIQEISDDLNRQEIFKSKVSFSLDSKIYKDLLPEEKEVVDRALITKTAKTSVSIVGPK